jgi:hypothetical protein
VDFFRGKKVAIVAAGLHHTLVLLREGDLYAFGWAEYGQLGLGEKGDKFMAPKPVAFFQSVCNRSHPLVVFVYFQHHVHSITVGDNHSFVLCEDGLYSFGWGLHGQLGHGNKQNVPLPKLIQAFSQKVHFLLHSIVLSRLLSALQLDHSIHLFTVKARYMGVHNFYSLCFFGHPLDLGTTPICSLGFLIMALCYYQLQFQV